MTDVSQPTRITDAVTGESYCKPEGEGVVDLGVDLHRTNVLVTCDGSSGRLAPIRAQGTTLPLGKEPSILQVGVLAKGNVPITSIRIGHVRNFEPSGFERAPRHLETVATTNECGVAILKQHFAETPGRLDSRLRFLTAC